MAKLYCIATLGNRQVWQRSAAALSMVLIGGCTIVSHLHDPSRLKVAEEASKELSAYQEEAPEMYAAMLRNLERFKQEEDALMAELAASADTAFITTLPTATGQNLREDREKLKAEIGTLRRKIQDDVKAYFAEKEQAEASKKEVKGEVEDFKNEVRDAEKDLTDWNAQVAFFQELIPKVPKLTKELKNDKASFGDVFEKFGEVVDTEVTFLDAKGETITRKISAFLDSSEKKDPRKVFRRLSSGLEAPGLALELATLGLQLAQNEQKRVDAQLTYLRQRATLMQDTMLVTELATALLDKAAGSTRVLPDDKSMVQFVARERVDAPQVWSATIGSDITEEKKKKIPKIAYTWQEVVNGVHNTLVGLRYHAVARSMVSRQSAFYTLERSRLAHQRSISRSKLADEAWNALVKSGLESLVAYERGGFKPEHLANFLRLAQFAALLEIAR